MEKQRNKIGKKEIVNVLIALGVSIIALFSFNYFKPGVEEMLSVVIFFLILIYLNLIDKE